MDYTHGKTRRKTRSVRSRRRSPSSFLISFSLLPRPCVILPFLLSAPHCSLAPRWRAFLPPRPPSHPAACFILTTPSRPYIVYMLQDLDILEDWTAIRKVFCRQTELHGSTSASFCRGLSFSVVSPQAMASLGPHRVKVDGKSFSLSSVTVNIWLSAASTRSRTGSGRFSSFEVNVPELKQGRLGLQPFPH